MPETAAGEVVVLHLDDELRRERFLWVERAVLRQQLPPGPVLFCLERRIVPRRRELKLNEAA